MGVCRYLMERYASVPARRYQVERHYPAMDNDVLIITHYIGPRSFHTIRGHVGDDQVLCVAFPHRNHCDSDVRVWFMARSPCVVFQLLSLPPRVQYRMWYSSWPA